jgi:Na+/melibiose symporter-like transporter
MSTINPDERARVIGMALKPLAFGLLYLSIAMPPIVAFFAWTVGIGEDAMVGIFMTYVVLCVVAGIAVAFVPTQRYGRLIAAYIFVYMGGLFLVMRSGQPLETADPVLISVLLIGIPYAIAIVLVVLHVRERTAAAVTATRGIDTTATVISASVDGLVNYVQHQRLTLKFTDNNGVDRYLRIGRTGGGYSRGDTLPLRYDPDRPDYRPAIVVGK